MLAIATIVVVVLLLSSPSTGLGETDAHNADAPPNVRLVSIQEDSSRLLWPYTSRQRSFDTATLPINVIVKHDPSFVRSILMESDTVEWTVTENVSAERIANGSSDGNASTAVESGVTINGTRIEWTDADGSTRYTYVHANGTGEGRWIDEYVQLHDGTYLGSRYHIRMYEGGSGPNAWTAMQVHREHWDWFRLRHTVDSVDGAREYIEAEFRNSPIRLEIGRTWFANRGPLDSDGWVTTIELFYRDLRQPMILFGPVFLFGFVATGLTGNSLLRAIRSALGTWLDDERFDVRHLVLLVSLFSVVLGVRVGAVAVENWAPGLSPKIIAGVFYPMLVVGTPVVAIAFARGLDQGASAVAAAVGFGMGILADYVYLDVAALPVEVVVHRAILVGAVAVFAAAGASESPVGIRDDGVSANTLLVIGAIVWIGALLIPLLDLL